MFNPIHGHILLRARPWGAVRLMVLGVVADGIVSLFDPRVRMSSSRAW